MSEENYKEKYEELKKEYDKLYNLCEKMLDDIRYKNTRLKEYEFLLGEHTKHNARGAGRKSKFTDAEIIHMKILHERGESTREIAKKFNCSHSTVNKLIKKQRKSSKNDL